MRVSKDRAAKNREALLQAASRLFRKRGIDATGVADIAKEAGLTHGALYAHFPSKEALAAEAFSYGFDSNMAATRAWAGERRPSFQDYLNGLLSPSMRDRVETACPLAAYASEVGRQGRSVSARFTCGFEEMVAMLENAIEDTIPATDKRRLAITGIASEVGAIAIARAIAKTDIALSDEVLEAVRETFESLSEIKPAASNKTPGSQSNRPN